jgi:competence protein ComEA
MKNLTAIVLALFLVLAGIAAPAPSFAAGSSSGSSVPASQRLDLNTATAAELAALPAIGDALAAKIVAGRPYAKKSQLTSRKILTKDQYAKIRGLVIARRAKRN